MVHVDPPSALDEARKKLYIPPKDSHKGLNGKLLIIGGSGLFHAASLWSASVASRIVDMVHYSSTQENHEIFVNLKTKFADGIIVQQKDLLDYVEEDDCILVGPGMIRGPVSEKIRAAELSFDEIRKLTNEAEYTFALTRFLMKTFPHKRFVFDAGSLQMMDKNWLKLLKEKAIVTPHVLEFENLFGVSCSNKSDSEKKNLVTQMAKDYHCVVLMKNVKDYISDGTNQAIVEGGNPGLAKGGSGDVLAGLASAFYTKSDAVTSCLFASFLLKSASEGQYDQSGLFYNTSDLIVQIGKTAKTELFDF